MDGFDWNVFAAGSAVVVTALLALVGLSRRWTRRRTTSDGLAAISEPKRRIDLVAIDEGATVQTTEADET
jgi:hypothetical protein